MFQQFIIGHSTMIPDTGARHAALGATGKSFRRSPAGAGPLQEAWLRLGSHSRDDLLELADEATLTVLPMHGGVSSTQAITGRSAGRAAVAGAAAEAGAAWPSAATAPAAITTTSGYLMRVRITYPFLLPGAARNAPNAVITRLAPVTLVT